ncbi:hypothetical protein EQV97_22495 [Pseudomonas sp. TMW22090]|uniref:hypothetical protein n=1 Tax=Pseudomonas sp. TMW22090 TaxID=2506434 RepID=UPI001F0E179C|nr:hypothetical protein [Pseudomonas sp. TMW22090]MCH4880133.1 hypothetical protein [Pseudomonas sp. TMW22090]
MKKSHGPTFKRELKFIVECNVCRGTGIYTGVFHQMTCENCHASGWVCGKTLKTLPLIEVVQMLNARLRDAIGEIAKVRQVIGGAHEQYERNNRRGAGGSNYTGD